MLGAGILWFGWFGFNGGSAFAADGVAAQAVLNTFVAAAAGMIAWLAIEWRRDGHATTLGGASGVVAGLVAITPAAGYVGGLSPIVFGAVASVACYFAIQLKAKYGYDDSLDVVGIHMVGGIVGGLLLGFFADASVGVMDGPSSGMGALSSARSSPSCRSSPTPASSRSASPNCSTTSWASESAATRNSPASIRRSTPRRPTSTERAAGYGQLMMRRAPDVR